MSKITNLLGLEVLDSRGDWTIECRLELDGQHTGSASVPSGASVGAYEKKAVTPKAAATFINGLLKARLLGSNFESLKDFDFLLANFADPDRLTLGANTLLSLSTAFAKAESLRENLPLFKYFSKIFNNQEALFIPSPLFNVINGGRHAKNDLDFQEFHFIVSPKSTFEQTLGVAVSFFHNLGSLLEGSGLDTFLGDEGGYAPQNISHLRALKFVTEAAQKTGLVEAQDFFLGLDVAASTLILGDVYDFKRAGLKKTPLELTEYYLDLMDQFPIVYLEDPFGQDNFEEFSGLLKKVKEKVDIAGDDLVVTDLARLKRAAKASSISTVIIKPNQIGTLSESLEVARAALNSKISLVVSHRSAETEDTYIADLAVGIGAKYIKAGAPARGERVAKYNRLLEIEQELKKV